ncbi:MAG TPA: PQQ-dependent sugar dehydrogenase, partial [Thermomicrobiales bacterium]|nr:PQQ-dependent sugar dehydrogenase [Thermomicrobiales bacterium]
LIYVDWNDSYSNGDVEITEYRISDRDPNIVDPASERSILRIPKPFPAHSGGTIKFGPDGYLYIAVGDGGWQGDPEDNAQNRFTLLGKILRIDVHGDSPGQPYLIPPDNPFAGPDRYDNPFPGQAVAPPATPTAQASEGKQTKEERRAARRQRPTRTPGRLAANNRALRPPVREEIWALGFRNPWQFAFDPKTSDFYVGDVGGSAWEEIDFQAAGSTAGQNYGWDWLEGTHCYPETLTDCPRQQVGVLPVAEYAHGEDGCAVVGIGVYRGDAYPSLDGIYFSGDFCTGQIRGLERDANGQWIFQNLFDAALMITSSGQDADGNLYITARTQAARHAGREPDTDALWKIVEADKVPPGAETAPVGGANEAAAGAATEGEEPAPPASPAAGGETEPAAATPAAKIDPKRQVTIDANDIYFVPKKVEVRANLDVTLELVNRGVMPHNFSIDELHVNVDLPPGARETVTIKAPPGRYRFYCNVPGHKDAGMVGTLVAH